MKDLRIRKYAIVFAAVTSFLLNADVLDKIAAIVGDEVILQSEIEQVVSQKRYSSRYGFDEVSFRQAVMNEMINSKVLYYAALKDSTISVSDEDVQRVLDSRINSIIEQIGGEDKLEKMYNTTVSELKKQYRSEIRKGMFIEKIKSKQGQRVSVNRDEVEKFFENYKDSLPPVKASISLSQLVIRFSDKAINETKSVDFLKDIKNKILIGELSFEEAAGKYSHDEASAEKGGNIGSTSRGDLVAEYERAAYNMSEGEISDPVKSKFGFHLIKLNSKSGEKISSSHILIMPEKNIENDSEAFDFALTIRDSVLSKNMTFEEAVRKYSGDEKTKYTGGNIGSMKIDEMDRKYSDLFASAQIGYLSDPVKEKDGYYIYKIADREGDHNIDLSTDYNLLKSMTLERKKYDHIKKWIEETKKNVYIEVK